MVRVYPVVSSKFVNLTVPLEALADPNHERHEEMSEWAGGDFDPSLLDVDALANNVAALAKKWARKPQSKRPPQT